VSPVIGKDLAINYEPSDIRLSNYADLPKQTEETRTEEQRLADKERQKALTGSPYYPRRNLCYSTRSMSPKKTSE